MNIKSNFSSHTFLQSIKEGSIDKHKFWRDLQDFYKKNEITNVKLFVSCFPKINELFKSDFASSGFYSWLEDYAESNPKVAYEIKQEIEKINSRDSYEFWTSIVFGLSKLENNFESEVIENIKSSEGYLISSGFRTATVIISSNQNTFLNDIDGFIDLEKFKAVFEDVDWAYLTNFLTRYLQIFPKYDSRIKALFGIDSVFILSTIARSLDSYIKLNENKELFHQVIEQLAKVPLQNTGIYNTITYRFDKYYTTHPEIIKNFLENWIEFHLPSASGMQALEQLVNKFIEKNSNYFNNLISKWLLKSYKYGLAVQYVISETRSDRNILQLDEVWLKTLSEDDTILLSLRVIGFAWDKDVAYLMLLQILKINLDSQEIINNTASLLYSELLLNYPSLIERLKKESICGKKHKSILEQIANKADSYFNRLSNLPILDEFQPSDKRLAFYNKNQFSGIGTDSLESKKPTFLDFVDKTELRAGKGFFSKFENEFTQIIEPKRISHSMEMPRLEFIDPIGQQAKRLHFRYISKDELYNS